MNVKKELLELIRRRIVVLDGAAGTLLQQLGLPQGMSPELWCMEHPEIIQSIHSGYQKAGADIVYTCTFGANRLKLKHYKARQVKKLNMNLSLLARKAAGEGAYVAGDIGPTGHFVKPFGSLAFEEAVDIYKEQVKGLLAGKADIFAIETMMDIQEARAALLAVKELTDAFVMVTMTFEKDGRTLNGTDPVSALITLQSLGADAVGCNCSTGPLAMRKIIASMKPYAKVPLVAKPNAGMPRLSGNKTSFEMGPGQFAACARRLVTAGANMIGGCCGTSPEHIKALKKTLQGRRPLPPERASVCALSSARKTVIIKKDGPLIVIGERINPTGKKELQRELLGNKMSLVKQMAKDQEGEGALALDVNVGVAGINEEKALKKAVEELSVATELPLCIDSSDSRSVEAALRAYPGRALINSISADKEKLKKLLPLARKYGAMFILLPLSGSSVPETARQRIKIIRAVFKQASAAGFTKDDFLIDALAMSIASHPDAAKEALKTISWCRRQFRCNTVLGLSNISFGMPARKELNSAFLSLARSRGLTAAIANTARLKASYSKAAERVLMNRGKGALKKLTALATKSRSPAPQPAGKGLSPVQKISRAAIEGNKEDMGAYLKEALRAGVPALTIANESIIPAIKKVGDLFEKKEYFLPQLIASAETTKKALHYLEPFLKEQKGGRPKRAIVVLGTVKGDIHDIGKNIVSLMLKNHGFQVIDLGKDVSAEKIVNAAAQHRSSIVGLSALMTTTMIHMKDVIALARKRKLRVKFIVGGAAVTQQYAKSIGAAYGKDGVEAVRMARKLTEKKTS